MKLNTIHLVPAYLILAKELDDVIDCSLSIFIRASVFRSGFLTATLTARGVGHASLSVRSYSKRRVTRRKRCTRALQVVTVCSRAKAYVGWLKILESNVLAEGSSAHVLLSFHCHHGSGIVAIIKGLFVRELQFNLVGVMGTVPRNLGVDET